MLSLKNLHLEGCNFSPVARAVKGGAEPLQVLFWCGCKNSDIIKIDNAPSELQISKTSLDKVLKHCWSICQPKWHLLTFVEPQLAYHEGR